MTRAAAPTIDPSGHHASGPQRVDAAADPEPGEAGHELGDGEGAQQVGEPPALGGRDGGRGDGEGVDQRAPVGDLGGAEDDHLAPQPGRWVGSRREVVR